MHREREREKEMGGRKRVSERKKEKGGDGGELFPITT